MPPVPMPEVIAVCQENCYVPGDTPKCACMWSQNLKQTKKPHTKKKENTSHVWWKHLIYIFWELEGQGPHWRLLWEKCTLMKDDSMEHIPCTHLAFLVIQFMPKFNSSQQVIGLSTENNTPVHYGRDPSRGRGHSSWFSLQLQPYFLSIRRLWTKFVSIKAQNPGALEHSIWYSIWLAPE